MNRLSLLKLHFRMLVGCGFLLCNHTSSFGRGTQAWITEVQRLVIGDPDLSMWVCRGHVLLLLLPEFGKFESWLKTNGVPMLGK